jgi:hypothetical protein
MNLKLLSAIATIALFAGSPAARASIVVVTYAGTVSNGFDYTGVFGTANADLTGGSYSVVYKFDTSKGQFQTDALSQHSFGSGAASPSLGATVTINGHSASIGGVTSADAYGYHGIGFATQTINVKDDYFDPDHEVRFTQAGINNYDGGLPGSFTSPFIFHLGAGDNSYGSSQFSYVDPTTHAQQSAFANATFSTLTVSAVPEPSTWAMMMLGFAGLAFAACRKNRPTFLGA